MEGMLVKNLETGKTQTFAETERELVIPAHTDMVCLASAAQETTVILQENTRLTYVLFATEGWEGTPKITFEFQGKNSELQCLGLIVGTGSKVFAFETISRHLTTNTKASYRIRAAMFDRSVVDYKGNLVIPKPAQLTDTYLSHDTLLLSDYARAHTVPALEIEANDVKAGHAATIGKVDDELKFYLLSRGIEAQEAEQLLINSFFESQLALITDEEMRESLKTSLLQALPLPSFAYAEPATT
jgi:Fe-S cluster assembly protein SufD